MLFLLFEVSFAAQSPSRLATLLVLFGYLIFMYWNTGRFTKLMKTYRVKKHDWFLLVGLISLITGDTIHEIYLIVSYVQNDVWLDGAGFYALMFTSLFMSGYYLGLLGFQKSEFSRGSHAIFYGVLVSLFVIRIYLGILPENGYALPGLEGFPMMRYYSNGVFILFGLIVLGLLFRNSRHYDPKTKTLFLRVVQWGVFSFLCFGLHLLLYPTNALFGMFMIPKSFAYMAEVYYLVEAFMTLRKEKLN